MQSFTVTYKSLYETTNIVWHSQTLSSMLHNRGKGLVCQTTTNTDYQCVHLPLKHTAVLWHTITHNCPE